jgi:glycyl-tRNA synthetase beta chain
MRDHQKYFAVEAAYGKLAPHFLAVLNIQVDAEGEAIIRHGNARVLRARFKDARFFWEVDQKKPLVDRVESLKKVTFFRPPKSEPWSYHWKTQQNSVVAQRLDDKVFLNGGVTKRGLAAIAAEYAKTDLTTELVKEFTELQGIIGGLYIRAQWHQEGYAEHNAAIADAIYSQYIPASMEDAIPATVEGQLFGLADRIQTIVAMFDIGQAPTGSKDPFALRRSANGIVKILAESQLPLTLRDVLESYTGEVRIDQNGIMTSRMRDIDSDQTLTAVSAFLIERLNFYLKDYKGYAYDVVNAVLAAGADDVRDAIARAEALTAARESDDFAAISAAFKRIKNILRQAEEKHFVLGSPKDVTLAPEAQQLADAAAALVPVVAKLRQQRAYGEALEAIATLRPVVDAFFDKVMVLDPDPAIRGAHLGLIDEVLSGFSGIADFSEIVTA